MTGRGMIVRGGRLDVSRFHRVHDSKKLAARRASIIGRGCGPRDGNRRGLGSGGFWCECRYAPESECCCFASAEDFSVRQSIVLALFLSITLIDDVLRSFRSRTWTPFQILFEPAFATMLHDLGLLEDPAEWKLLVAKRLSPPPLYEDFESLGRLRCIVLMPGTDDASELFIWGEVGGYFSELEWLGRLEAVPDCPVQSETQENSVPIRKPDFFIRLGPGSGRGKCFSLDIPFNRTSGPRRWEFILGITPGCRYTATRTKLAHKLGLYSLF